MCIFSFWRTLWQTTWSCRLFWIIQWVMLSRINLACILFMKRSDSWGMEMSNAVTFGILRLGNKLDTVWTIELKVLLKMKKQEIVSILLFFFSCSKKIVFSLVGDVPAYFFHLLDAKCLQTYCTMSQTHSCIFYESLRESIFLSLYR